MLVGSPLLDQDALHEVVEEAAQDPAMVAAAAARVLHPTHQVLLNVLPNDVRLSYRSAYHRFRCQAIVKWPLFAKGAYGVRLFSAEHMRRRCSCNGTRWALTAARFRYLWFLVRRGMKRLK